METHLIENLFLFCTHGLHIGLDSVDIFLEKYFRLIVTAFVPSRLKKML